MRVHLNGNDVAEKCSNTLLKIGNGIYAESDGNISITRDLDLVVMNVTELIKNIYPDIINIKESQWTGCANEPC